MTEYFMLNKLLDFFRFYFLSMYVVVFLFNIVIYVFLFLCLYTLISGFGGLGVACWPLVTKFAGSNPAEAVGFLGAKKSSARLPSERK